MEPVVRLVTDSSVTLPPTAPARTVVTVASLRSREVPAVAVSAVTLTADLLDPVRPIEMAPLVVLVALNTRLFAVPVTSPFRVIPSLVEVTVALAVTRIGLVEFI